MLKQEINALANTHLSFAKFNPYSDAADFPVKITCYSVNEILAEKNSNLQLACQAKFQACFISESVWVLNTAD